MKQGKQSFHVPKIENFCGNKKRYLLLTSFAIMILVFCQSAISLDSPTLKTTLLRYEPTPAQPGSYATVYIQVENIGNAKADNTKIQFVDNYPFSIDNEADKTKNIGLIGIGQTVITDFKVRIDEKSVSGVNQMKFVISDPVVGNMEKIFDVTVSSLSTDLTLKDVKVSPSYLNPGDLGKISITLKNNEDAALAQISTKLVIYAVSGSTAVDLPFAIEDTVSKKTISVLKSGEEGKIEYGIQSYPSINPGIYKLPLLIEFFDGTGKNYSKTEFVTIVVNPKVDAYITIDSSSLTAESKIGPVVFKIVNKGFGQIQFANLKIGASADYDILTPYNQLYIGSIDSDDYKTGEFQISAKKDAIQIPVTVEFKDSLNNNHEINTTLSLTLFSNKQTGQKSSNNTWMIVLAVVIIGAGIWYFRRKNKKK